MLLSLILSALLAFCTIAEAQKSPNDFLTEADRTLRETFAKCQPLADQPKVYQLEGLDAKLRTLADLEACAKSLNDISNKARQYNLDEINDVTAKQAIRTLKNIESKLKMGNQLIEAGSSLSAMDNAFEQQNIDLFDDDQKLSLRDIERADILLSSESVDELDYYWRQTKDEVALVSEELFFNFLKLVRRAAKAQNLTITEFWYPNYSEAKMAELEQVMQQIKPFYEQLQAYTRYKILKKYGAGVIKPNGPIPEHLYKQFQAHAWHEDNNYLDEDFPYENLPSDKALFHDSLGYDPSAQAVLEIAEHFYESLGFNGFTPDFWKQRIIKLEDGTEDCHSKVYDSLPDNVSFAYCNGNHFSAFAGDHEHLGRVHSALLKQQLPIYFYDGNSMGEPFGRAVKFSAVSAQHMKTIGLAKNVDYSEAVKTNINFRLAFETLFTLNYEYVHARLIIDFLDGKVKRKQLNRHYWKLLEDYAGIEPPIDRHEDSFDLPYQLIVKFMTNRNLIRDFENSILAFQFYKAACDKIGHMGHLSDCDFYNQKAIGRDFKQVLSLGSSKPFEQLVSPILPNKKLDGNGLLAYFDMTNDWLKNFIETHKMTTGWEHTNKLTFKELFHSERDALLFIKTASDKIYELFNQINGDLFQEKDQDSEFADDTFGQMFWKLSKSAVAARDLKDISLQAKKISASNFKDKKLKRALKNIARMSDIFVLGADMQDFYNSKGDLYNTSTDRDIRMFKNKEKLVALYPDIREVFQHSNDEEELKYYWEAWREENSYWAKMLLVKMFDTFKTAAKTLGELKKIRQREKSITYRVDLKIPVADFWFKHYNTKFVDRMEQVIKNLHPLYNSIHHYVKTRLVEKYGPHILSKPNGAIPDHLVEQVLLQIWTPESIVEQDFPFSDLPSHDQYVQNQKFSALDWLRVANQFYVSMGFTTLEDDLWNERLKPQPGSANATNCHATIFDMTPKTYMKYCDKVSYRKVLQAHGYMGRLHYAAEKSELPAYFFDSYYLEYPVGEAVILSASTPKHSQQIALFKDLPITEKVLLNRQIRMAIHTLFNLHKYFVHTKVMLKYLQGEISEDKIGKFYWKFMVKYAGIEPPVNRDAEDFDFPYEFYPDLEQNHQVKKFVSEVLGYQIYETLCKLSGHTGDLNNCDFYNSVPAGDALKNIMKLGSSVPRKVVLSTLLPEKGLHATALLNYYEPLKKWFQQNNVPNDKSFSETTRIFKG